MVAAFARRKLARVFLALLVALLVMAVLSQIGASGSAPAQAAPPEPPPAPISPMFDGPYNCTIKYIFATSSTVMVQCTAAVSGVIFQFAPPTDAASVQFTNRMLVLINTAYSLGKTINVFYTLDSGSNPPGCLTSTCRRLDGVYIGP